MTPAVTHMVLLFDGGFRSCVFVLFFFFNDTATTEIYTLSLHDALPISLDLIGDVRDHLHRGAEVVAATLLGDDALVRSEEHTSELQSQSNLVCRLLLEKKKMRRSPRHAQEPGTAPCLEYDAAYAVLALV